MINRADEPTLTLLGERYRIERELGRGGMATVFLATDTAVGRAVAVKVLNPDLAAAVGADRFHREIRIATRLAHPHILPVYDSGESGATLYYVMPLVEGESLRERLRREGQLSIEDAVRISCEVANALDYAHKQGIVHRDIKPENILLEAEQAVVADFGIARVTSMAADAPALTQSGMSLGTPAYVSPEQALGDRGVNGRSDQYALACVTYEMLVGEPPFSAASAQTLMARHLNAPVPLITTVRPTVPDELQDVIMRALEKVPADRYPTIAAYAAALVAAVNGATTGTRSTAGGRARAVPPTARSRRALWRSVAGSGLAIACAAAAGAAWHLTRPTVPNVAGGEVSDRRVAVLYFQDHSADRHLGFLADGLTEALIARLRDVQSLDVLSRDAVMPFRETPAAADSAARALRVGTIITGAVEPAGDGVKISLRLIDGPSGAEFRSASFTAPLAALTTARDSVAEETARLLRAFFGEELQLRTSREQAHDARAWTLYQRAERLRKDGDLAGRSDPVAAVRDFVAADSLLASARTLDPAWSQPGVLRAQLALRRARLETTPAEMSRWIDAGLAQADSALALDPRSADALEARGTLRYLRVARNLSADPAEERALVRGAESDLRQATEINPTQASAFSVLSAVYYRKNPPDLAGAHINARRALEADAYLASANDVLWSLVASSYDLGEHDEALKWCGEGRRRFPSEARFVLCDLYIGFMNDAKPNIPELWQDAERAVALAPEARRPLLTRQVRLLVAVSLAAAGQPDSARHVLESAKGDRTVDPEGELVAPEALVRVRLGQRAQAIRVMKAFITTHPQHRAGLLRNTWWWSDLESDPEFRALAGGSR
jgi:serine/threonine-protein kinase